MNKEKIILIIIFLLAFFIRSFRIGETPPLLWDEAALGYNAYSILHTARDEHGQFLPLIFKSFGDYKPGVYVYLTLPFVALFGLNPLSTRLPSILAGSLIPIFLYLLVKTLSPKQKYLPLITALLITLNPFNIHFSRGAWESNILLFQLLLGSYLFSKKKYLLSTLIFSLSFYTYQSAKMLTPLLIVALIISQSIPLKTLVKKFFPLLFLFSLPMVFGIIFGADSNRLKVISLLSYPRSTSETNTIISETNRFDYLAFHNRIIFFSRNFLSRYFNHFSPRFLAFEGDWQNPRHSAPYIGVLLYPSLIFLVIGLFTSNYRSPTTKFFFFWLLLAPLASALSRDSLSAVRSLPLSIPLVYFTALGLHVFVNKYKSITIYCSLFTIYILSFIYYSDLYLNHLVKKSPKDWLYGYQQATQYLIQNQSLYSQIIFSPFYGQPYIYYLFYSQYPPHTYQQNNHFTSTNLDTGQVNQIDNIHFAEPNFAQLQQQTNVLAIFSHDEVLRQNIDPNLLIPLSPINTYSTFYAYQKP